MKKTNLERRVESLEKKWLARQLRKPLSEKIIDSLEDHFEKLEQDSGESLYLMIEKKAHEVMESEWFLKQMSLHLLNEAKTAFSFKDWIFEEKTIDDVGEAIAECTSEAIGSFYKKMMLILDEKLSENSQG